VEKLNKTNTVAVFASQGVKKMFKYIFHTMLANRTEKTGWLISMPWYIPNKASTRISTLTISGIMTKFILSFSSLLKFDNYFFLQKLHNFEDQKTNFVQLKL
jgi:hypothetical protein